MKSELIPIERVQRLILQLRGEKVLLGQQLAELYGVPVKVLTQAVKRNRSRFPADFMFQVSREEFDHLKSHFGTPNDWGSLRSQFVTLKRGQHLKYLPYAFTEQGVAMLSSVLRIEGHDQAIKSLFGAIRELMTPPANPRREIGFHIKEDSVPFRVRRK